MAEHMYKSAGAAAGGDGATAGATAGSSNPADDNVIDAEFEKK
jgi:hypothetical protein